MKKIFISIIFLFFLTSTHGWAEDERYRCLEVKTDLVDGEINYRIEKKNHAGFEIKGCLPEAIKVYAEDLEVTYSQSRRLVENGKIESNDLFAIECTVPLPENYFSFYSGRISPLVTPAYPLYPTLKQTAERLGIETPSRTFIIFDGYGRSTHEFFCYLDGASAKKTVKDSCRYTFDEVLDIHTKNRDTLAIESLAEKYFKRRDYAKAEKAYIRAMELSEHKDPTLLLRFYFATKQYSKARRILSERLKTSPYDPLLYTYLAEAYFHEGNLDKAEELLQKALRLRFDRELYRAYEILGEIALARGDYSRAIASFLEAIGPFKEECEYNTLLKSYRLEENASGADCNALILPYQLKIVHSLIELEDFDRAEGLLGTLLERYNYEPSIYSQNAYLYAARGDFKRALEMTDRAVSMLKQRGTGATIQKGEIYPEVISVVKDSPAYRAGIKRGDRIVNIDGRDVRLLREEGDIVRITAEYMEKNDKLRLTVHSDASSDLRDIELQVQDILQPPASEALAIKALILRVKQDRKGFEKLASKAYNLNPEDKLSRLVYSLSMADRKRYNHALEVIRELEEGGRDNLTLIIRPIIYAKVGKMDRAREMYKEIPEGLLGTKNALYKNLIGELKGCILKGDG